MARKEHDSERACRDKVKCKKVSEKAQSILKIKWQKIQTYKLYIFLKDVAFAIDFFSHIFNLPRFFEFFAVAGK